MFWQPAKSLQTVLRSIY